MDLEQLRDKLTQENAALNNILVRLNSLYDINTAIPPPIPYPGYTTRPRFGFMESGLMEELETLTKPLI